MEKRTAEESFASGAAAGENGNGDPENESRSVPSLDEAIEKIPASTRRQLDELFRGKFIAVKPFRKEELY